MGRISTGCVVVCGGGGSGNGGNVCGVVDSAWDWGG